MRTCRACCLICDSGDDDADEHENIGDGGADHTFDFGSSLDGDPSLGVAIRFSSSSGPRARCSNGDISLPVSTLTGCARKPETDGDSFPSIAAEPVSEADREP